MVEQCTNPDISSSIPSLSFPSSTASSLYHVYLLRLLREARDDEKQVLALFDAVLMFLKHPLLVAEERLLSLLHLLRTFITSSQNLNEKLIQTLIELIRPYYLWPLPHGLVAKELLQMLSIELKSRGSAIRSQFFEDVPELVEGYKPSGRERVVHVLIDKELDNAERMKALLEAFSPPEMDLRELHLRLLCHSLLTHLRGVDDKDEDEPLSSEFLSLLQSCSLEDAQEFSWNASQILNQALLMNEAKAELFRISQLTSLKEDIIKHLSSSKTSKTNDPSSPSPSFSNGLTHLPSMNFEFHSITSSPLELITNYESPLKYARSSTADCLAKIFSSYQSSSADKQDNKPIVRIAIAGTDQTLHNVVGAFVYLRATRPTLFASSSSPELRVYHLPIVDHSPSRLSTFLSSRDVWYARNVCAMLQHVQRIVPAVPDASPLRSEKEQEEQTKQAAKEQQHDLNHYYNRNASPSCILRQALENYFREARNRVELNLWQAECWSENGAYRTIPFLQKAELGLEAFGIAYKMANSLDSSLTVKEMMEKKLFKYTPPSLSLKFTQVNLGGMARPGPTLEAKAYSLISLSSVPSSIGGERGTPPHPSQPWLELYALDSDVKKRKTKVSEERVYHVAQIELEVTDKRREPVDLLLDDVLYGPFIRIKISRCVDLKEDDIAFTLPMMTFFPTVNQL
ncbi:1-phosphatidylinositol-3-kinase regulator [Balamuthia mandrillaris]